MKEVTQKSDDVSAKTGFAPTDYTDGQKQHDWKSKYEIEARKCIRCEAIYLAAILIIYTPAIFLFQFSTGIIKDEHLKSCVLSFIGGTLGGTLFAIKWLIHSVGKGMWHLDRRLWRLFTPHLSGAITFFSLAMAASGLFQVFNKGIIDDIFSVIGFSFLIGYFSDKAIAKLADTADTLFGTIRKEKNSNPDHR